jgi:hypothetical protein
MEVLTAYVRENAPWPPKSSKSPERDFIKPPEGGSVSDSASNAATEPKNDSVQGVEPTSGALGQISRRSWTSSNAARRNTYPRSTAYALTFGELTSEEPTS